MTQSNNYSSTTETTLSSLALWHVIVLLVNIVFSDGSEDALRALLARVM